MREGRIRDMKRNHPSRLVRAVRHRFGRSVSWLVAVGACRAYGALVASQFDLASTESGFEANTVVATPTNFPSFR